MRRGEEMKGEERRDNKRENTRGTLMRTLVVLHSPLSMDHLQGNLFFFFERDSQVEHLEKLGWRDNCLSIVRELYANCMMSYCRLIQVFAKSIRGVLYQILLCIRIYSRLWLHVLNCSCITHCVSLNNAIHPGYFSFHVM